ncbi:hypothetical protein AKJ42_00775 [candidate division MSBL1 archaeon SCGC-AAA261C02]|uniref:Polymerase/histidinol phosphatase N-terminal domain-containing protein n=1 Tax=candidate division MSBL1 archaeon SCGC-AAA261C02 TaxID=1698272 RepID=A0A133V1Y1_9EURY|nr:hypothetical protein AKJ42_00775 [candidate division MSBL1 archaeon SCGC-AAA261C02]
MMKRIDLHTHTLLSDGELVPAELARRAEDMDYEAIGLTDHVDSSNLEWVAKQTLEAAKDLNETLDIRVVTGVELTHVPPSKISELAKKARELNMEIVAVHGETSIEPVLEGTNKAALECDEVNLLVHPGLITSDQAELARDTQTYLELTSRRGHCLANGQIAKLAQKAGASLLVNTDAHVPEDLLTREEALMVAKGAGLNEGEARKVVGSNPQKFLEGL